MFKIMLDQADIISFFFISWVAEVHIILQQHVHWWHGYLQSKIVQYLTFAFSLHKDGMWLPHIV